MIAIPNMDRPKSCQVCPIFLWCYTANDWKGYEHCPIIEIIPCKECKNSHMTYGGQCKYCDLERDDDDNFIECYFDGDHFCSYGARK